ncbi:MAG: hypothetical protein GY811_03330 [Myxococcales bacterium]|nr:hypothetical protein [Myxococcales bacterium]
MRFYSRPGCAADDGALDENGKPTLDGTGYEESPTGKSDGLNGRRGPNASFDDGPTEVWNVTRDWGDTHSEAGLAWGANSGLSWDEKFSAWVDSLEKSGDDTFVLTTPYNRSFEAPDLECAETAMFLRITFASWYELPFFMEASNAGKRIYFGHMGIITDDGTAWGRMPNFNSRYPDYSSQAASVTTDPSSWPQDESLRSRKIGGSAGDGQTAFDDAHAGTYFDEIYLNKRVGYFLTIQLAFLGSMNLADSANTFNLKPAAFQPGDFLIERFDHTGIGHTIVIKEVRELETTIEIDGVDVAQREAEVISGSMPRRQGDWEGASGRTSCSQNMQLSTSTAQSTTNSSRDKTYSKTSCLSSTQESAWKHCSQKLRATASGFVTTPRAVRLESDARPSSRQYTKPVQTLV